MKRLRRFNMTKLKLIGDSILAYMPKDMLNGVEERHAIENAPTALLRNLYPKFKDSPVDVNILCLGINDYFRQYYDEDFPKMTTQEIVKGLAEFIDEIHCDNNGELMVLSLLPIRQTYPWEAYYSEISKQIPIVNTSLSKCCKSRGVSFVDTYSHFADENGIMREDLSDDGVHPNQKDGYRVLSNLINNELKKLNANQSNCVAKEETNQMSADDFKMIGREDSLEK